MTYLVTYIKAIHVEQICMGTRQRVDLNTKATIISDLERGWKRKFVAEKGSILLEPQHSYP